MKDIYFSRKNICVWQIEHEAHIVILRGHQHANLNQKFALISRTGRYHCKIPGSKINFFNTGANW